MHLVRRSCAAFSAVFLTAALLAVGPADATTPAAAAVLLPASPGHGLRGRAGRRRCC